MISLNTLRTFSILFVAITANPVEKRGAVNGALGIPDGLVPLLIPKTDQIQYPLLINPLLPKSQIDIQLLESLRDANQADMPVATKGIFQNFYNILAAAYQEITRRQNALLNIINCSNCSNTGNPWLNFLNTIATIPTLQWVNKPSYQNTSNNGVKPDDAFIVATNQNGMVSGVGGSIVNGEPSLEYSFVNNQFTPIKPNKPNRKPSNPTSHH